MESKNLYFYTFGVLYTGFSWSISFYNKMAVPPLFMPENSVEIGRNFVQLDAILGYLVFCDVVIPTLL